MAWQVWGDPWESGELADATVFQSVRFNSDIILRAIRTWVIVYNDPTFTDLTMKIYSDYLTGSDHTVGGLLATSNTTLTKSQIITLENGVKEIYFEFDYFPVQSGTFYNFVINGTGYVYSVNSHLSWMKGWPDPVYSEGYTPSVENLGVAPYQMYAIGGAF